MKRQLNILTSIIIFVSILSMTSCKKYTCECTAHNIATHTSGGHSEFIVKGRKNKANNECENHSTETDQYGNVTTCEIK